MKNLKFVAVTGKKTANFKSGERKGQEYVTYSVQTSDGKIAFLREEYLTRKLALIGATLNEFLANPANYQLNVSSNANDEVGEIILRTKGEVFKYTNADGKEVESEPVSSTHYDVRGSYTISLTQAGSMSNSVANILASKMAAQFGLNLGDSAPAAQGEVAEIPEEQFEITDDEEVK